MNLKDLEELNKECAQQTKEFFEEFVKIAKKYMKKSPRMGIVNMVHLPLNGILNVIAEDENNIMCEIFPELPDMFIRFMRPFIKLKPLWGQIPNEEWVKEYGRLHGAQFDEWFPNEEEKKNFTDWFEAQNKQKQG